MATGSTSNNDEESFFQATLKADDATSLTDGVLLRTGTEDKVILPWIGFGTYKLGKDVAFQAVMEALECGYRCIDTAFIYGGETTERLVGKAIQQSLEKNVLSSRQEVFVVTKHWRKYHGYEETLKCLNLSLKRLQLDYVDLYLMHWPGPAWKTMSRRKDILEEEGPWYYAADNMQRDQMAQLRSETWRAMEDSLKEGKCRSIGVSNFTVEHLKALKQTATIWPPAVNQVEFHPLYPQKELLEYCRQEGIVLQAYASLGGQDTGKKQWSKIALEAAPTSTQEADVVEDKPHQKRKPKQKKLKETVVSLMSCRPVVAMAQKLNVSPAQILLRWALSQNCVVIPKTSSRERMLENAAVLSFSLTQDEISVITDNVQLAVRKSLLENSITGTSSDDDGPQNKLSEDDILAMERSGVAEIGRLCWRNDPLRQLDFE